MLKSIRTLIIGSAAALPLAMVMAPTQAGTAPGSFTVSTTVVAACNVTSATALTFPNYDPTSGTATPGQSTINVTCTKGSPYIIALDYGANSGSATDRIMKGSTSSATLDYNLYTEATHTDVWDNSTTCGTPSGTSIPANCEGSISASGTADPYTVYGQITASQNVPADTYNDTIQITVTF